MKKLHSRDILFKEGSEIQKLFVVHKGELLIQKKEGSKLRNEGTVGPRSVVGIEALFHKQPYPYTLRAMESVDVEEVSKEDLQAATEKLPVWFPQILSILAKRK